MTVGTINITIDAMRKAVDDSQWGLVELLTDNLRSVILTMVIDRNASGLDWARERTVSFAAATRRRLDQDDPEQAVVAALLRATASLARSASTMIPMPSLKDADA